MTKSKNVAEIEKSMAEIFKLLCSIHALTKENNTDVSQKVEQALTHVLLVKSASLSIDKQIRQFTAHI